MRQIVILMTVLILTGSAGAQKSWYNKEFKFGFKAPATGKISTEDAYAEESMKGLAVLSFKGAGRRVPASSATVAAGAMTREACTALAQTEDTPRKKKFGTIVFDRTEFVEGGMETVVPMEVYRAFHKGVCYEVRFAIPQEKYPKHPVNDAAALARMYPILRTMYFRP